MSQARIAWALGLAAVAFAACGDDGEPAKAPTEVPGDASGAEAGDAGEGADADASTEGDGAIGKDASDVDAQPPPPFPKPIRFALIGDYGVDDTNESAVAQLVIAEEPEFVLTLGDNNYPSGLASTIDQNVGKYYHSFIHPYGGSYGAGATVNRFWPCLGNHDWATGTMQPYADYFALPGNERYWDLVRGSVHIFCLDSDSHEPDGRTPASTQGTWLQNQMAGSTAPFQFVLMHHAPYSSGEHGDNTTMQWPYASYGADAVFAGHDHDYERLENDGIPYVVQGSGGAGLYSFTTTVPESVFAFNQAHGTTIARADDHFVVFESLTTDRDLIDLFSVASKADANATKRSLVAVGSTWRYKDDGAAPPAGWADATFDASSWKSGKAKLGYGQVGVVTTISYGPSAQQKYITTYFRTTFSMQKTDDVKWLLLKITKDDGAVVHVNGKEIFRTNMPSGAVTSSTPAKYRTGYVAEDAWEPAALDPSFLVVGENSIAVELHQVGATSSDAVFDLSLDAVTK